ncbi:hypothetical protein KO489_05955 [Reinekea forsetii]|nr:hypothetical protein [Reinekea forsetii]
MAIISSVKAKLLVIIYGSIFALSVIAFIALGRANGDMEKYSVLVHTDELASELALRANLEFKRQVQEWKNVLIRGADAEQMAKYWDRFNSRHDTVQDLVNQLLPLLENGTEAKNLAKQFLTDHSAMKSAYSEGRNQFIASGFDIAVGDNSVSGIDRAPSAALDLIVERLGEQVNAKISELESSSQRNTVINLVSFIAVIIVVALVTLYFVSKVIIRPLSEVADNLAAIGEGDISTGCRYQSNDEIGNIANTARLLQSFLTKNVETMKVTSSALTQSSAHLSDMSNELAQQSKHQYSATEQVATAVQELTHSAEEVSNNSGLTSDITKDTAQKSSLGTQIADSAKRKSMQLVSDLNSSGEVIKELAENAANVSSVLDVIRAIAEQTNLLALNAAIEAARAGDQGRGFAVVADEVRTLAQRTQDSTTEIERILENVKTGADNAVVAIDKGQLSSQATEKDITEASSALQEIADMVAGINEKNIQIANASKEQTEVAMGISSLISDIQSLAEDTDTRVNQTQSISKELDALIKQFDQQIAMFKM